MRFSPVDEVEERPRAQPGRQLLKWVGNKQRFAPEIISYFPSCYGRYFEPFLGSGAVLGTLEPAQATGSDVFKPLVEIWQTLHAAPETLKEWYQQRWQAIMSGDKVEQYEKIKAAYNAQPNGADLLFLCRACYGGVVRFRQKDGYMSTPCGIHASMPPASFAGRVDAWHRATAGATFALLDYQEAMSRARTGDLIYCDPPYSHSQSILYGAQAFDLTQLFSAIADCKTRGVYVALSIDGTKRSGNLICDIPLPSGLFEQEALINCGRSMLKRFQMDGQTLEEEVVADRLLLTY
jgi:DNA adenine methylase